MKQILLSIGKSMKNITFTCLLIECIHYNGMEQNTATQCGADNAGNTNYECQSHDGTFEVDNRKLSQRTSTTMISNKFYRNVYKQKRKRKKHTYYDTKTVENNAFSVLPFAQSSFFPHLSSSFRCCSNCSSLRFDPMLGKLMMR